MAGWDARGLRSVVVLTSISSIVGRRLDEVPVGAEGVGWVASRVGVVGRVVGVVVEAVLSVELGLSLSLSLSIEGLPVAEVVVRRLRLVEVPGVAGVGSGVTVVVVEALLSVGPVEQSGVSLRLSLSVSVSLSLGHVDGSDRVSQISAAGSIAVGHVLHDEGAGGGIGGDSRGLEGGVAGVSGHVSGVTVVGLEVVWTEVSVGPVEGISLSLSGSEGSATDLRGENVKRRKSRIVILPQ